RDHSAMLWAERATEELRRIPIRRGAPEDLTPTEEQVAELVGAGRSNPEVAQALFMSRKAVEANLTRIYAKLGIRSRAELGLRLLERHKGAAPAKKEGAPHCGGDRRRPRSRPCGTPRARPARSMAENRRPIWSSTTGRASPPRPFRRRPLECGRRRRRW